jgi:hypothetical protein
MSAAQALMAARAAGIRLGIDGVSIVLEADHPPPSQVLGTLRAHKPEIIDALRAERRAVVRHIADHFQSSPLGRCVYCGGDRSPAESFVAIFCGTDRAELHPGCHPAWVARRESEARAALGIDPPDKERRNAR